MHIWYNFKNKNTYQKKIIRTMFISLIIPIIIVIFFSIILIFNHGNTLEKGSFLHFLSVAIFVLFFIGSGVFAGYRSIQSNILKFIFVRTIHNKLLVLHIQQPGFTNLFGYSLNNLYRGSNIVSQIQGAVDNLKNISATQQLLDSIGNFRFLYYIELEEQSYKDYGWEVKKVLKISNRLFYYHITYLLESDGQSFVADVNIPKNYQDLDQLLMELKKRMTD